MRASATSTTLLSRVRQRAPADTPTQLALVDVTFPERACQAETVFPPGWAQRYLRERPPALSRRSCPNAGRRRACYLSVRLGCRRRGKSRSFLAEAIAPYTFLRELPAPPCGGGSAGLARQTRIHLVRIPRREGHSIHSVVPPPPALVAGGRRIQGHIRVGPNGRGLEPRSAARTEQPGRAFVRRASSFCGRFRGRGPCATMRSAWAEGRALLAKQPERRPRGQHRMGRHDAALFHSGLAPKR